MNRTPNPDSQLGELRRSLALLASSETDQRAHLVQLGTLPSLDELGLEFDDIYPTAHWMAARGMISEEAERAIDGIARALREAGREDPYFWDERTLTGSAWQAIRGLARRALAHVGAASE